MLFIFLSIYIPKFLYCLISIIGRIIYKKAERRKKCDFCVGLPVAVVVFGLIWLGATVARNNIMVNRVEVYSSKLPASMDGLKILQFSDLHSGTWGHDTSFVSRLVDSINNQNADIVVFTGDFVNRTGKELLPFVPVLKRVNAPLGVYAVLGNHDYGGYADWPDSSDYKSNLRALKNAIKSMGWKLLTNQSVMLHQGNDSIAIIGVENWGEPPFNQLGDLVEAYGNIGKSKEQLNDSVFKVLLTHNPNHWTEVVQKISNVDLSLAGHTHAMQMAFKIGNKRFSPAVWKYPEWGGLYEGKSSGGQSMYLYVNVGVGEVAYPSRLGNMATPELNLITLRKDSLPPQ